MNNHEKQQLYGADAVEWLRRWDAGDTVHSIEMGGLGPGYEQAIQVTMAEILRFMIESKFDVNSWSDKEKWTADRDAINTMGHKNTVIENLGGITGAQWSAALNLAGMLYRYGPVGVMDDARVADRHIQVRKSFP